MINQDCFINHHNHSTGLICRTVLVVNRLVLMSQQTVFVVYRAVLVSQSYRDCFINPHDCSMNHLGWLTNYKNGSLNHRDQSRINRTAPYDPSEQLYDL